MKKPAEGTAESKPQQPDDSHNISVHVKKVRGGRTLYGPKKSEEKLVEFMAILKILPIHRTPSEHNAVWKMLRTIPDLTSHLIDKHLKILSKNVISETWVKGSTDDYTEVLGQWSTFGTLEVTAQTESETKAFSVVAEEDCEILKISAKNYAKLKSEKTKLENKNKVKLIHKCPYYVEWPTLSIYELVTLTKKKFPPGHVIVESGNIISFVAYINSGYCKVYRSIVGLSKPQSRKVKKIRRLVYMGKLKEKESFGEISVLLQVPFTYTIVTGKDVEMAIIEDKDLLALNPITKKLMLQTAKSTFGHLSDEDVKNEYLQKEKKREWTNFKDKTMKNPLYYNGIIPGFEEWNHSYRNIRRHLKDTLVSY
ncbi:LOW QUALITY PROTEIN: cyclic nucleotide-binding domain-containing protein 1 [Megaptera novaeangliae]